MAILTSLLDPNEREVKRPLPVARAISALEPELKELDDGALRARSDELRDRAREGQDLDELLMEAFALCREAGRRTVGLRHFDVQLVGGIVLHHGKIAEMKTGEGKTLVASLALYLNALAGKGVHLVTVNDYLARRDAGWMAPIYHLLGMSVGVNVGNAATYLYDPEFIDETHPDPRLQHLRPVSKRDAYHADITYATNSELAFDYLRDNMAMDLSQCSQRKLYYAIVDEVDSILIDEARTPHIISGQSEESTEKYYEYARWAARLNEGEDYEVDLKHKSASLTEAGIAKMERWTGIRNIYDLENVIEAHQINQALKAKALFLRDRDYIIKDGEIVIVDEFTGRTMHGRRWSDGLHQAVEAKEGVQVKGETQTLATITIQNYFRLYDKLAGMTGTAETEETEFHEIYKLGVTVIPTNRPVIRDDRQDLVYKTRREKYNAILEETQRLHELQFPVLVGTVSVDVSETVSRMFKRAGIPHNVLNAKYHQREAEIVAGAGQPGAVTIATNMAGRGTDIKLGPGVTESKPSRRKNAENEMEDVVECGGLHIIGSERHESRRIDRQLRGRAGRQGDPGASQFFLSLEDDLMRLFGSDRIARLMDRMGAEEGEMLTHSLITRSIEQAQKRVELQNFQSRKRLLEYDDVMNQQREVIYSLRSFALEGGEELKGEADKMVEKGVAKRVENMLNEFDSQEEWDFALVRQDLLMHYMLSVPGFEDGNLPTSQEMAEQRAIEAGRKAFADKLASLNEYAEQLLALVMLHVIDEKWKDHLYDLDQLRNAIGYRSWGQKDPLIEYKHEAYNMFVDLMQDIHNTFTERFLRAQITFEERQPLPPMFLSGPEIDGNGGGGVVTAPPKKRFNALGVLEEVGVGDGNGTDATLDIGPTEAPKTGATVKPEPTVHVGGKTSSLSKLAAAGGTPGVPGVPGGKSEDWSNVGRNDPCRCGSGKKFKKCHGANL